MLTIIRLTGIIFLTCFFTRALPQEQLGLRLSNYSGIHGTLFNPAFSVTSPVSWNLNVLALGAFAENNYIFIMDAGIVQMIGNRSGFRFANSGNAEAVSESAPKTEGLQYDFTTGALRKEGYICSFVTGPSAMFHIRKHAFGIFFNVRTTVSANRIPSSLGYYDLDALVAGDTLFVKPLKMAGMAWSEAGVNYGKNILRKGRHVLDAGVSLKFLQGYEGFFFQSHQHTTIRINIDSMTYQSAHVTYGLASGITGYGDAATAYKLQARGFGASADIGAVYQVESNSGKRSYDWKLGFALLDFGKINFTKNAQKHEIDTDAPFNFVQGEYKGIENFTEVFQLLSAQSLNDPYASYAGSSFGIWMPAGITFFVERAITKNFYLNATAVRRLRFGSAVVERGNLWAITPRFEHKWLEVHVPIALFNDTHFRFGTAIRMGPLVIGTDNLSSWFIPHDFTGSDIYVALKFDFIAKNEDRQQPSGKKKGRGAFDCFYFNTR